jgi:hypothetical protein
MSPLELELQVRRARFRVVQVAMRNYEERVRERYPDSAYAYMAGFFQSQLLSLAVDRADTTDDLIKALNANIS